MKLTSFIFMVFGLILTTPALADFSLEHYSNHPEDYFIIAPSSIVGNSGFGLYVKNPLPRGLTAIPKGVALPYPYPGNPVPTPYYIETVLEFLTHLTVKYDLEQNLPVSHSEVQKDLNYLNTAFGIRVIPKDETDAQDESFMVNWDNLNDKFVDYAFDITGRKEKQLTLFWNVFSYQGEPIIDHSQLKNMALFANEPPPYDFINLYTLKTQKSEVSLKAVEDRRRSILNYVTLKEAQAGEELFLSYGPTYAANRRKMGYQINMSKTGGCGMFKLVKNYLPDLCHQRFKNEKNLVHYLSKPKTDRDFKDFSDFFENIPSYVHPASVEMSNLGPLAIHWFTEKVGPNYADLYAVARKNFLDQNLDESEPELKRVRSSSLSDLDSSSPEGSGDSNDPSDPTSTEPVGLWSSIESTHWFQYICGK